MEQNEKKLTLGEYVTSGALKPEDLIDSMEARARFVVTGLRACKEQIKNFPILDREARPVVYRKEDKDKTYWGDISYEGVLRLFCELHEYPDRDRDHTPNCTVNLMDPEEVFLNLGQSGSSFQLYQFLCCMIEASGEECHFERPYRSDSGFDKVRELVAMRKIKVAELLNLSYIRMKANLVKDGLEACKKTLLAPVLGPDEVLFYEHKPAATEDVDIKGFINPAQKTMTFYREQQGEFTKCIGSCTLDYKSCLSVLLDETNPISCHLYSFLKEQIDKAKQMEKKAEETGKTE